MQPTTLSQAFNNNVWNIEGFGQNEEIITTEFAANYQTEDYQTEDYHAVCDADNDHDEDNGDDSEKNDNIEDNTDDGKNTKSLSEHDESVRSQNNKSTLSSEDFCGVSLADAYEELNNINIK